MAIDFSDRLRAEEALRQSEEYLRAIVETSPACIKVVAPDGTLLDKNSAGLAMVDADGPENVKGKCVYALILDEYRDSFREFNERVCRGEKGSLEFEIVGLRGTTRHMETYAVPLRWPGPFAFGQSASSHCFAILGSSTAPGSSVRSEAFTTSD
ncbi:MAG TPA: PAS domain-containing protein [Pirellula sp.]|nr:PAS domain-containing protein [Pirellula sp.]